MNMEFIKSNYFNTTTQATVASGTDSVYNLFDLRPTQYYQTSGENVDGTTTSIRIEFSSAKNIDRIILQNINFKGFRLYYNSNTANLFSITSAATSSSEWSSNSETSLYLMFATVSASIITIDITSTMIANAEKYCGQLWIAQKYVTFPFNPPARGYKPNFDVKQYVHELSDGGVALYSIDDKFKAKLSWDNVSSSFADDLYTVNQEKKSFGFTPNPTGTSWENKIYEVNWVGDFNFIEYHDDYKGNGYKGDIDLREVAK